MVKWKKPDKSDFYFLIPFSIILIAWQYLSYFHIINPALISSPIGVVQTGYELFTMTTPAGNSVLLTHIVISMYRLFISFAIAVVAGIAIGILMGANIRVYAFCDPVISLLMPIPGIAWAPIFMIWLGFGDPTIITVAAFTATMPIIYNVAAGVRSTNKLYLWAAQSMGAGPWTLFFRVYIPSSAAYIMTGIKLGLSRGWKTIIAVEMIAASLWGLGYMIYDAREYLQPAVIYLGIIILALIFYAIENGILRWVEIRTVEKWGMLKQGEA